VEDVTIRAAAFDFTGCEGCQLNVGNLETQLPTLLQYITFVEFRLVSSAEYDGPIDIAFVEGAISKEEDIERVRSVRERASVLVAMGACADLGGVNRLVSEETLQKARDGEYGKMIQSLGVFTPAPVSKFVKVDHALPGCPIDRNEFLRVVGDLVARRKPRIPDYAVCHECRQSGKGCLLDHGKMCVGMITRGGCDAVCTVGGAGCEGCRGLIPDANVDAMVATLTGLGHERRDAVNLIRQFLKPGLE